MTRRTAAKLLAAPAIAYLALFCLAPLAIVASYSFRLRDYRGQVQSEFSLKAWALATESITLSIVFRSILLALAVTAASLAVGYPAALALAAQPEKRRRTLVVLMAFPLVTSLLLRIYGWLNLLPLSWKGTYAAVALVMVVNYLPFMVLPLLRALERSEPNVVDAALDLGATPWQTFWRVTWPITRPGMWAGAALVFIPACGEYLAPHFIGEGKVTVIGGWIVQEFMERRNWPYAAACAIWLAALVLVPAAASLMLKKD